jgi:hypothetical protein
MSAFISQTTRKMPLDQEVQIASPVLGSTIAQIINGMQHLAFGKARETAIAFVSRSNVNAWIIVNDPIFNDFTVLRSASGSYNYIHLFRSSKICEHVGFILKYYATEGTSEITVSLVRNPTTTQDIIDSGCNMSIGSGELVVNDVGPAQVNEISSSDDTSQTGTVLTSYSRPLYVPEAYRGELLALNIACIDTRLDMIGAYELYKEKI